MTSEELKLSENGSSEAGDASRSYGGAGGRSLGVIDMEPLSSMIICLMDKKPEAEDLGRKAGVICHISSLGEPVLGTPAKEFADYLASAGMKVWQTLPLNPTGLGGSPYSSFAAFAGYPAMINRKELPDHRGYEQFCKDNMDWLCEYISYSVLKEMHDEKPWYEWPDEYKFGDPLELVVKLTKEHGARIEELAKDQYYFHVQWNDLKKYCNDLGISLMGDLPMYMAKDSADVWANKDIFRLDENGAQKVHAGVPPDAFSEDGQDWGNPLYDWERLRDTGYEWWLRRLRQCAQRFDILRIDHFRGFSEYYAIPEGESPKKGSWQHSAGLEFFRAVRNMLDRENLDMKLLAEDLGFLDAGVKNLLKLTALPGMDIWQFTADEMMELEPEKAATRAFYTGTHDNDTLAGFVKTVLKEQAGRGYGGNDHHGWHGGSAHTDHNSKEGVSAEDELLTEVETECLRIIRKIYESPAALAMVQIQDMFMLGSEARINVPGIAEGNWTWKMPGASVQGTYEDAEERAAWFRELAEKTNR
jgi:4-alpha-glucanotransferase